MSTALQGYIIAMRAAAACGCDDDDEWRQERIGEAQAIAAAGPWPIAGSLLLLQAATRRAVHAAVRAHTLEYRWCMRFRLWEHHDEPRVELHTARITARRHKAIEIAEDREYLLRRLCDDAPAGRA